MKTIIIISVILFFSFSVQSQEKDNTLSPEEFARGWELLFDGETLDGWKAYNGNEPQTWEVRDNSLYCTGSGEHGGDDIITVETFEDFDLKFEWRIVEDGNSGVIYRVREGKQWRKPWMTGPEYQVFDENENYDTHAVGAFYDVYPPSKNKKVNSAMEWNSGRIRISDGLVIHWVNGEIVMQCVLHSEEYNKRVANSKWSDNPYFGKSPFGHIDFQNHGAQVWYKNIKIKRLD